MSGLAMPFPKYKYPEEFQQSSRLTYYASLFGSIEINSSFYALPKGRTISRWTNEVPENFKFTFKLWKQITHSKNLNFLDADVKNFMEAIESAGKKKGCLLVQFPGSIKGDRLYELQHLLHSVQSNNIDHTWHVAVEFRDNSWYHEDTYDLVRSHNASIVIHDKSRAASYYVAQNFKTIYVRFHGPQGDYRGSYSDAFLDEYAMYIHDWLVEGKSVFVYFNNTMGNAFENLNTLNLYVTSLCNNNK